MDEHEDGKDEGTGVLPFSESLGEIFELFLAKVGTQ